MPRRWLMFAGRIPKPVDDRAFANFGDERYVRAHGREPVAVELTEDPDGMYWGWIYKGDHERYAVNPGEPTMIQPHRGMFNMQFAYGVQAEVERGRGEIVRLSVREISR